MHVGIEKINLYPGRLCLDFSELARVRGTDLDYVKNRLMCESRSVFPPWEDAVSMAVNAAQPLLSAEDREAIELVIVGTECGVDFAKSIAIWAHRYCGLSSFCRNFEVKHACYAGTAALKMAAFWVASQVRPGKKALVIVPDFSHDFTATPWEYVGGGCAVAMLISTDPQVLQIELAKSGYWAQEMPDYARPTSKVEVIQDLVSVYSYLDAMEAAYEHFEQVVGDIDYDTYFKKHIYHMPFPGMALQAHQTMLSRSGLVDKSAVKASFERKVRASLYCMQQTGGCYSGSSFAGLIGLIKCTEDLQTGDTVSLFAYGGGCQAEFYSGVIGPGARSYIRSLPIDQHLHQRMRLSVEQYELVERTREKHIDSADYEPIGDGLGDIYKECYADRGLLVLKQVKNYQREYGWS
jgi:hydroxymethylglutaryl-CoA synthase